MNQERKEVMNKQKVLSRRDIRGKGFKQWLDALRSGDYEQGEGTLMSGTYRKPMFCVLGVAHDTYLKSVPGTGWYDLDMGETSLPVSSADWTFNGSVNPEVYSKATLSTGHTLDGWYMVTELNDCYGATLEEIADIVESYVDREEA